MHTRERMIVYGLLGLLLVVNLPGLLGGGGRLAVAEGEPASNQLGPADGLTLVENDQELRLRSLGGRLAWSDAAYARAFSMGFVHVGRAMGPLLDAPHFVDEREELDEEIKARDEELDERIGAFLEEHQDVGPDGPAADDVRRAYQQLFRQRERWRAERTRRLGSLAARQIEAAYRDLQAAVEVVAERRAIDIVLRFIPPDNEFASSNPPQAYRAIRARVALKYPEALDITDAILEELDVAEEES
ncbi:MAG: OmpH family outer membrane protein [Planctomycetes bacterium]|nr:OmpH family outer membrane protein [Planctomycetota bacterium]